MPTLPRGTNNGIKCMKINRVSTVVDMRKKKNYLRNNPLTFDIHNSTN